MLSILWPSNHLPRGQHQSTDSKIRCQYLAQPIGIYITQAQAKVVYAPIHDACKIFLWFDHVVNEAIYLIPQYRSLVCLSDLTSEPGRQVHTDANVLTAGLAVSPRFAVYKNLVSLTFNLLSSAHSRTRRSTSLVHSTESILLLKGLVRWDATKS
ncbi:hypothetical protein BDN71DRAFT_1033933 [Pleurotus eryngii]|uniref:Uncharacterized protein n=1 Tax=Pleurotus eryngii TaxID=5323 RepID=A0A9P6DDD8_PLEER|nr:hypothetical protein BDN71DRAFT_1033933 [Pleurotus eryngii]